MKSTYLEVVVARELTFCVRLNHSKQLHRMEVVHLSFNVRIRLTHSVQRKKKLFSSRSGSFLLTKEEGRWAKQQCQQRMAFEVREGR